LASPVRQERGGGGFYPWIGQQIRTIQGGPQGPITNAAIGAANYFQRAGNMPNGLYPNMPDIDIDWDKVIEILKDTGAF
jgi:hypothetical protein